MSKRTRKCPDCGAQMPQGAAMCSKCGYKPPEERVDSEPRKLRAEAPRPVETSRWPDRESYEEAVMERKSASSGKNIWQLAIVGALILVILVIAVVLIIKMTAPADGGNNNNVEASNQESQIFDQIEEENQNVHVIESENVTATEAPAATEAPEQETEPAEEEEKPDEEEPEPTPEPTEEPDFAPDPSITISEMNDTVYVTGNGVNLRVGPGTEYNAVTSLSRGEELKRTGVTNNGWSQVDWDGEEAYLSNNYVSEDKPEPIVTEKNDTVYVTGNSVNLRKGAGTDYDVITGLTKGTELKRTGTTDNGWTRVEYNGETGYLSSKYVSTDKPESSTAGEDDNVTAKDGTVVVTSAANLRTEPSENGDVIAIANANVELKRTGVTDDGWTRVEYDGKTAYVHSSLLKEKETSGITEESGTLTVTTRANIRSGPSTNDSIIATVDAGTTLTKTGKTEGWFRVTYNDKTGYISDSLVAQG